MPQVPETEDRSSGSGPGSPAPPDSSASVPTRPQAAAPPTPGVRLGVDVGTVRIGVAVSDAGARVATPVETVRREATASADLDRLAALAAERDVVEVVVGLPRSLSGGEGPAARAARDYAERLARRLEPVPVRLFDERLTTVSALRGLREAGVAGRSGRRGRQGQRRERAVVDQVAAAIMLQAALDADAAAPTPFAPTPFAPTPAGHPAPAHPPPAHTTGAS